MAEHELYIQQGSAIWEAELAKRLASQAAAFLMPYLRAGMHVLDAGCGPGSITLGLAAAVALGEVVDIDVQRSGRPPSSDIISVYSAEERALREDCEKWLENA